MKLKMISINFTINGEKKQLEIPAGLTALELIRDRFDLKGSKEGCGIGECGACTIVVDGRAVNACLMFAAQLDGCEVLTVEGLTQDGEMHPIQEAFAEKHAVQFFLRQNPKNFPAHFQLLYSGQNWLMMTADPYNYFLILC